MNNDKYSDIEKRTEIRNTTKKLTILTSIIRNLILPHRKKENYRMMGWERMRWKHMLLLRRQLNKISNMRS